VRESLFNMLTHGDFDGYGDVFEGTQALDAFCGSGALGLEARSRGADHVVFMDNDAAAISAARGNAALLNEGANVICLVCDVTNPPVAEKPCSLVFLDPPYGRELAVTALTALREKGWLAPGALCVVETAKNEDFFSPPKFTPLKKRRSGTAQLHILRYMGTA
jgi:16S rRNA (guanine966-N2)-methyltransferase